MKKSKFLLVASDGYSIDTTSYNSKEEASNALKMAYELFKPNDWLEEYAEISWCGEESAMLYNNGGDVCIWSVEEVVFELTKEENLEMLNEEEEDVELE